EDAVDTVEDIYKIITKWQKKVLNFYNKNFTKQKFFSFSELFINAIECDNGGAIKNKGTFDRLQIVMRRTGDITIDKVDAMIKYKQARNRDAYKSIWNPFKSNWKHNQVIEHISIANHR
ncbi:5923_t:CDS:1, partial [Funneliformis mosseae]